MEKFKITKHIDIICESQSTRSGFRHVAVMLYNGREILRDKACYQNRTWERYQFESVLHSILHKRIDELKKRVKEIEKEFETLDHQYSYPTNQVEKLNKEIKQLQKALRKERL